jgi:hypothetical protein
MHLLLAPTEEVTVYRVKYWSFADGTPPALQLEYEPPFSVDDTVAARREAVHLWPAFAPYLEANGLTCAIVTATNLRRSIRLLSWLPAWLPLTTSYFHSFGLVAAKGPDGAWRFEGFTDPLPPADSTVPRIQLSTGEPLTFDLGRARPTAP